MTADERRVLERLYLRILGRPPRPDEIEPSLALVHAARVGVGGVANRRTRRRRESAAWAVLGHALFCSTSFQYLD